MPIPGDDEAFSCFLAARNLLILSEVEPKQVYQNSEQNECVFGCYGAFGKRCVAAKRAAVCVWECWCLNR